MACEGQYRSTVLLEVEVTGRFIRYEHGFRYSKQRVLAVHVNRCLCGRPATVFVDSGAGVTGWLQLQPCCLRCSAPKETITLAMFRTLLGDPSPHMVAAPPETSEPVGCAAGAADTEAARSLNILSAEVALLQARVDNLQAQVSRLTG